MKLNEDAKIVLRDAGVSQAAWARANFMAGGKWSGDACGCPDGRCKDGYHHFPDDECGCLRVLLESYLAGEGTFAEFPKGGSAAASASANSAVLEPLTPEQARRAEWRRSLRGGAGGDGG